MDLTDRWLAKTGQYEVRQEFRKLLTRKRILGKVLAGEPRGKYRSAGEIPKTWQGIKRQIGEIKQQIEELIRVSDCKNA